MLFNKLFRTPKNQVSTPRPECGVGFDSSARAMNRDTKENVSLVSFERKQMLNTLKRKIALVAVSAVGMSGLALMSAPAANAAVSSFSSVATVPTRAATGTQNTVAVSITAANAGTSTNLGVAGETVTVQGRVLTAPTPAAADSLTQIAAGDSVAAINTFLANGAASSVTLQADSSNSFNTAGTYSILLWQEIAGGTAGAIDANEAYTTASITIGGTPTSLAVSPATATVAGTIGAPFSITLKDAVGNPTLLKDGTEKITILATTAVGGAETLTVSKGTSNGNRGVAYGTASRVGASATLATAISHNDSVTASTGAYSFVADHSVGATSSTFSINLGGTALSPTTAASASLTSTSVSKASKLAVNTTSGVTSTQFKYTAVAVTETPGTSNVWASTTGATSVEFGVTGTAGATVNVEIVGSTVAGVTSGIYPVVIDSTGKGKYVATATTASGSYTFRTSITTSDATTGNADYVVTYAAPTVSTQALGTNGVTFDLLSTSLGKIIKKIGDTTTLKATVKDQYGTPKQYYSFSASFGATTDRNYSSAGITAVVTDANGEASISLKDVSTSTTNLVDSLVPKVAAPGDGTNVITGGSALTINYSATGLYASLALAGGTTSTTTVSRGVQSTSAATSETLTLTPTLKDALGSTVAGIGIVYTGSEGVYFRTVANAGTSASPELTTLTAASDASIVVFGTKPGTATVTATGGGLTATATFTVSAAAASTARVIKATAAGAKIAASVTDGFGNPVAGVVVNFASDSKGIFGNGVSSTSATTDSTGSATAAVQSADGTPGTSVVTVTLATAAQSGSAAATPVATFAAGVGSVTASATTTSGNAGTDTAITAVKTDVATANAAVKALATQVTVLQASVATLIDSLTTQIASLMKSVSALTKAVAKLQAKK